jgi:hypothetical protein
MSTIIPKVNPIVVPLIPDTQYFYDGKGFDGFPIARPSHSANYGNPMNGRS